MLRVRIISPYFGDHLFGRVDQVSGRFFVATLFFHVFWVPLYPKGTYLVMAGSEGVTTFTGIRIPFSWKSFGYTYLRFILTVAMLQCVVAFEAPWSFSNPRTAYIGYILIACLITFVALFFASYWWSCPSPQRALELESLARQTPEEVKTMFK